MVEPLSGANAGAGRALRRAAIALTAGAALAACGGGARAPAGHRERIAFGGSSCASGWTAPVAGVYDFSIVNRSRTSGSATLVTFGSGVALGAATHLGANRTGSVSVRLQAGADYQWSCELSGAAALSSAVGAVPGTDRAAADGAAGTATVGIAAAISTVQLIQPLSDERLHVEASLEKVRAGVATLRARIAAGDLAGARRAWLSAHVAWLEIGQDDGAYGAFGALGGRIDGLSGGDLGGTSSRNFTGFHRVEFDLFRRRSLRAAGRDARVLGRLVGRLTPAVVTADLPANAAGVDAWVLRPHEILEDALRDTLTGADDYGSGTELASLVADVTATRGLLTLLAGLIEPRAPSIVRNGLHELAAIDAAVAAAHRTGRPWPMLTSLAPHLRHRIDGAVDAAVETLAPISELLQVQGGDS